MANNRIPDELCEEIAIHIAATGDSYAATGRRYGIGKTTVRKIAMEHAVKPIRLRIADELEKCDYLPTPSEILAGAAAIRATWSPAERWKRLVTKAGERPDRGTELSVYAVRVSRNTVVGFDLVG